MAALNKAKEKEADGHTNVRWISDAPIGENRLRVEPLLGPSSSTDRRLANEFASEGPLVRDVPKQELGDPYGELTNSDWDQGTPHRLLDPRTATIEAKHAVPRGSTKYHFDELKMNFLARYAGDSVKSVLFVGTARGDGASTAAFYFARSLAQDIDSRVLFINADLRGPPSELTGSACNAGIASLGEAEAVAPRPTRQGNLHVLPGGRGYADPAVLFQSKRFDTFMAQVSEQFDYVILDAPPLEEAPESIALSAKVNGVMLVIDAQRARATIALRTKQRIQEVGGRLLGIVLNRRQYYIPAWLYERI
jgi:Mrp family chromosome partitioning ATPase